MVAVEFRIGVEKGERSVCSWSADGHIRSVRRTRSNDPTQKALGGPAYMKSIGVIELLFEMLLAKAQSEGVCRREIRTMSVCHEEMQGN